MKAVHLNRTEIVIVSPINLSRFSCLAPQNIVVCKSNTEASMGDLPAFLRKHQTHIAMQTQNMLHNVETVDITAMSCGSLLLKLFNPNIIKSRSLLPCESLSIGLG